MSSYQNVETYIKALCQCASVYMCVCLVMWVVAACESTSTDSVALSQCSTAEEQTETPSPCCPPPTCKSAAIHLIKLSALTFVFPPLSSQHQQQLQPSLNIIFCHISFIGNRYYTNVKYKVQICAPKFFLPLFW